MTSLARDHVNTLHSMLCHVVANYSAMATQRPNTSTSVPLRSLYRPCLLPCVYVTSLESRRGCYSGEEWCILTVGPPFMYTIPNFEALAVEMRQIRVERTMESGEAERYDAFIRSDSGLSRTYPAAVFARDTFMIEVRVWKGCMMVCVWGGGDMHVNFI